MRLSLTMSLVLPLASCALVTDLDRFHASPAGASNFVDLKLTVRGMRSHVNELFEYRVVDSTNTVQSRGFVRPLGGVDASMFAPGAVPRQNGPFHLDFYADHDNSGGYNNTPNQILDHAWRLPIDLAQVDENGALNMLFDHNTSFNYLDDPAPAKEYGKAAHVHFTNMASLTGRRVELRIADASAKRTVALFRVPSVTGPDFNADIPGMIESGVDYDIEVASDDGASGDLRAFRVTVSGTANGLSVDFDPARVPPVNDAAPL
jgi:hypothetical protein